MIVLAGAGLAGASLFAVAADFWTLLLVSGLFGLALSSLFPLSDNLAVRVADERNLQYGRLRLWGSISFILAAVLGGRILEGRSEGWSLALVLMAMAAAWLSTFFLPDPRRRRTRTRSRYSVGTAPGADASITRPHRGHSSRPGSKASAKRPAAASRPAPTGSRGPRSR